VNASTNDKAGDITPSSSLVVNASTDDKAGDSSDGGFGKHLGPCFKLLLTDNIDIAPSSSPVELSAIAASSSLVVNASTDDKAGDGSDGGSGKRLGPCLKLLLTDNIDMASSSSPVDLSATAASNNNGTCNDVIYLEISSSDLDDTPTKPHKLQPKWNRGEPSPVTYFLFMANVFLEIDDGDSDGNAKLAKKMKAVKFLKKSGMKVGEGNCKCTPSIIGLRHTQAH
jgi:hypothetical protein